MPDSQSAARLDGGIGRCHPRVNCCGPHLLGYSKSEGVRGIPLLMVLSGVGTLLDRVGLASSTPRQRRWHVQAIRVALTSLLVTMPAGLVLQGQPSDLRVYRAGGYAWLHDVGLYSSDFFGLTDGLHLPFVYPPLAAVLFAPMTAVPWPLIQLLFTAAGMAALAVTAYIAARRIYGRTSLAPLVATLVTACWLLFEPSRETVSWGQVNLILMGMVAADCLLPRTRWPRGVLLGLAAAIKLTPAVFGLYFLLRRQYKAAGVSAASFAGFGLIGFALAPADSVRFWTDKLFDDRVGIGYYANQGVRAVLHRFDLAVATELTLWAVAACGLLVLALVAARRAVHANQHVTAVLAIAVWSLLSSPISWSHHWVWIVVAAVALPHVLARSGPVTWCLVAGAMLVFVTGPPQLGSVEPGWLESILVSPYLFVGVGLLIAFVVRLPRRGNLAHSREQHVRSSQPVAG